MDTAKIGCPTANLSELYMDNQPPTKLVRDTDEPADVGQTESTVENQVRGEDRESSVAELNEVESPGGNGNGPSLKTETIAPKKKSLKERILHEVVEVGTVVIYLAVAFAIIETFRCGTLLARCSENDFLAGYATAGIGSLLLGKFVFVLEKTRLSNRFKHYPLVVPVLYKSVLFTVLVNVILHFEGHFLKHVDGPPIPMTDTTRYWLCFFAHQLAFFVTFVVFFCVRDLNRVLGEGKLFRMFFVSQK